MRPLLLGAVVLLAAGAARAQAPWETWKDPSVLPRLFAGDQVVTRSSFCPSGCEYDRTSDGDGRFLRTEGDEQVILEETGPGAIVRIWMTAGQGTSEPLDPDVRIRIRLDGPGTLTKLRLGLPLPAGEGNAGPVVSPGPSPR